MASGIGVVRMIIVKLAIIASSAENKFKVVGINCSKNLRREQVNEERKVHGKPSIYSHLSPTDFHPCFLSDDTLRVKSKGST